MRKSVTAALFGAVLCAGATGAQAQAQSSPYDPFAAAPPVGKAAGTFMLRLRAIGVMPENLHSSVSGIGGQVDASRTAAPEVDLSYFFTDHIAVEAIAATTRHAISAVHTAAGQVDVGSTYILPPTITAQYHFMPHSRFSPYVGAGLTIAFFYDTNRAAGIDSLHLDNTIGPAIQAGFDYNINGHWFLNFDVKQAFIDTKAHIDGGAIVAKTSLDPTIVGAGIGYRF